MVNNKQTRAERTRRVKRITAVKTGLAVSFGFLLAIAFAATVSKAEEPTKKAPVEVADVPKIEIVHYQQEQGPTNDEILIAKTLWGEARGCSRIEQEAVVWCILNRVDDPRWGDTVESVVTQKNQFQGYSRKNPVKDNLVAVARDVLERHKLEKETGVVSGRVLPAEYCFFVGDGKHNWFTTEWMGKDYYSLPGVTA